MLRAPVLKKRGGEGRQRMGAGRSECSVGKQAVEGSGGCEGFLYSQWQCVVIMAPLESVHFSECVHVHVMCVHV